MDLGTASILVQLFLIILLVALFSGRRHFSRHRDRYLSGPPTRPAASSRQDDAVPSPAPVPVPVPARVDRTEVVAARSGTGSNGTGRVAEELLPFADTCADWTSVDTGPEGARTRRAWDVTLDRVCLDLEDPARSWAMLEPFEDSRPARALPLRGVAAGPVTGLSCTIARRAGLPA